MIKHSHLNAPRVAWDDGRPQTFGSTGTLLQGDYAVTHVLIPVPEGIPADLHYNRGRLEKIFYHIDGQLVEATPDYVTAIYYTGYPTRIKTDVPMIFHGVMTPTNSMYVIEDPKKVYDAFLRGRPSDVKAEIGFQVRMQFHYLYEASPRPPRTQFNYFLTEIRQARKYGFKLEHVTTRTPSLSDMDALIKALKHEAQNPTRVQRLRRSVEGMDNDVKKLIRLLRELNTQENLTYKSILIANGNKDIFMTRGLSIGADTRYSCLLTF